MTKPRIKITPPNPKKGDVVEVKTLISHLMESGFRKDKKTGKLIPRKIINRFEASFDGTAVFQMDVNPAISANPYIKFYMRAEKSGSFRFKWIDDDGTHYTGEKALTVS